MCSWKVHREDIIITITISQQIPSGNAFWNILLSIRIGPGGIDLAVLMLFLSTLLLITILSPHSKMSKLLGMRVDYLTLTACTIIFLVPLLGIPPLHSIDRGISLIIAFSMIAVGLNTGKSWGSLLLCIPFKDEKPLIKQVTSSISCFNIRFPPLLGFQKSKSI
jgi:hypothetical protein